MESSIFVLDPIKGVFWPFKVDRRIYLTDTVHIRINAYHTSYAFMIFIILLG